MADSAPTSARLEAFSDGVIAVIITIMVLEIKVPQRDGMAGLRDLAPGVWVYLLSFVFTGTYWLNHQHVLARIEKAGHGIQCANLGFLFCLSLLPLSTAYVAEKHLSAFAVGVYAASLLVVALSFLVLRLAVHTRLMRDGSLEPDDRKGLRNHLLSMAVYAAGIACASFFPRLVLGGIGLLTLFWVLPGLSLRKVRQDC